MSIFSKFDIRGKYPEQINETVAYRLGVCLGQMIQGKQVIIGTDIRENSQKLVNPLAFALEQAGFEVIFLEEVATEMVYYAVGSKNLSLGIQITASHNPWDETGFKIVTDQVVPLASSGKLEELKTLFEQNQETYANQLPQNLKKINLNSEYAQFTASLIPDVKNLGGKVLIVSFGKAGADLATNFFTQTKVQTRVAVLGKEKLGDSPPNPMIEANQELAKKEINEDFDLVVMLDGDSDRAMFINPQNKEVLFGDLTAALLAQSILEQKKGPIVFDIRKKMVMQMVAQKYDVDFYQAYTGYPFIKQKMRAVKAVFGGEVSGHYFYPNSFYSENSMLSIISILAYLKEVKLSLGEALAEFSNKIFSIPEENFDVSTYTNFSLEKLTKDLITNRPKAKVIQSDGIIVEDIDFYLNLRLSQNEPLLRLNIEARSEKTLGLIHQQVKAFLK